MKIKVEELFRLNEKYPPYVILNHDDNQSERAFNPKSWSVTNDPEDCEQTVKIEKIGKFKEDGKIAFLSNEVLLMVSYSNEKPFLCWGNILTYTNFPISVRSLVAWDFGLFCEQATKLIRMIQRFSLNRELKDKIKEDFKKERYL